MEISGGVKKFVVGMKGWSNFDTLVPNHWNYEPIFFLHSMPRSLAALAIHVHRSGRLKMFLNSKFSL